MLRTGECLWHKCEVRERLLLLGLWELSGHESVAPNERHLRVHALVMCSKWSYCPCVGIVN